MPTNFQSTHNPTQQFQHPAINYMMPIPPDPTPTKFMPPVMPPPVTTQQPTAPPGPPAALPVRPQKAWLTPSPDWTPGDGMFDVNQLYNFSLLPTLRMATCATCQAWIFVTFAWFRSFMGASPTGSSDRSLTADS